MKLLLLLLYGWSWFAPAGIPPGASAHWDLKGGAYWTWTRTFEHGCAAWMAKDSWASVQLLVNSRCQGDPATGHLAGRGLSYFSAEDHLTFAGYWPWSQDDHFKLIEFDANGMIKGVGACPHTLSAQQINDMRLVAKEALADARTDGEKRVLTRVEQRLASLDGAKLASGQAGCTDDKAGDERIDPWTRR